MARDLYDILGVTREASDDEIRRTYRKLARKFHPDVNPGKKEAEERFKEISAAYEVLSDEKKRKAYDEFGEDSLRGGFDPEKARSLGLHLVSGDEVELSILVYELPDEPGTGDTVHLDLLAGDPFHGYCSFMLSSSIPGSPGDILDTVQG